MYMIWSCTLDVQAATMIYNNPRGNLVVCTYMMYAIMLHMMLQ